VSRPPLYDVYPRARELETAWRDLAASSGGQETIAGRSVEGRPLWRFDLGSRAADAPTILLTALIHGVEVIGSLALLDSLRALAADGGLLRERARLVVLPIMNPDALAANMDRLEGGHAAGQRKNANGVDLNRNFPTVGDPGTLLFHPFSGSGLRFSPHFRGPRPLSEPESLALHDVATEVRPQAALGFHSFGNMLLYPWGHTRAANPRAGAYRRLTTAFSSVLRTIPYRCGQAIDFYPTVGDLDDWLDDRFGTLALTVEVGNLDRRLWHPRRLFNAFCWMNPSRIEATVRNVTPGVLNLLGAAVALPVPA
jgi:carboxypeptidase T